MTFLNAREGLNKIKNAEILAFIVGVIGIITAVIAVVAAINIKNGNAVRSSGYVGVGLLALIISVLGIIAFILNLIGLSKASKDEPCFNKALTVTIVGIVLGVFNAVFSANPVSKGIFDALQAAVSIVIVNFVLRGIMNIAAKLDEEEMIQKGEIMLKLLVGIRIAALVLNLVFSFLQVDSNVSLVVLILLLVVACITSAAEFIYVKYLISAVEMVQ